MELKLARAGRLLIVGAGRSGRAAAAAARRLMPRLKITLCDIRPDALGAGDEAYLNKIGVETALGRSDSELLSGCGLVIKSPGVPGEIPLLSETRRLNIPVWGEVEFAWRFLPNLFVGVTGTNGKTTTTELIGHILKQAGLSCRVAGNVGTALSSFAGEVSDAEIMVVELSSFQLEDSVLFRPDIAVMLNLTEDHLDRHHGIDSYAAAKQRIFVNQAPGDVAAINMDDPGCRRAARATLGGARLVWFSAAAQSEGSWNALSGFPSSQSGAGNLTGGSAKAPLVFVEGETIYAAAQALWEMGSGLTPKKPRPGSLMLLPPENIVTGGRGGRNESSHGEVSASRLGGGAVPVLKWWKEASLKGRHNLENSLAAVAVSLILGASAGQVAEGLKSFPGVKHRLQEVRTKDGVLFVNDSKATNVDAAVRALSAYSGGIHLILGGSSKSCSFDALAQAASGRQVSQVIAIGDSAPEIAASFKAAGRQITIAQELTEAVQAAARQAKSGDVVLLSPACASFDQYKNYEERGEHFIQLVNRL